MSSSGKNILDSFFVKLGFDVDNNGMEAFERQVKNITKSMHMLGALAGIEVVKRIGEFVERAVQGAAAVNDFSEATGIAVEDIAAMGKVGLEASASFDGVKASLQGVAVATGQVAMGIGRNVKLFALLGINAKDSNGETKKAVDVMAELADKFQGMSDSKRLAIASRMGIDANLAAMMAKEGGAGFRNKLAEARGGALLTAKDYEEADATAKSFERLHKVINGVATVIAIQLAPWINKALAAFQGWWKANRAEVVAKVQLGMRVLGSVFQNIWQTLTLIARAGKTVYEMLDRLGISAASIKIVLGAIIAFKFGDYLMRAASATIAFTKALFALKGATMWVGLLAIAIGLLVEDIIVWRDGGQSVLKDLWEKYPNAIRALIGILGGLGLAWLATKAQALAALAAMIPRIWAMVAAEAAMLAPWVLLAAGIAGVAYAAKDLYDNWGPVVQWFGEQIDALEKKVSNLLNKLLDISGATDILRAVGIGQADSVDTSKNLQGFMGAKSYSPANDVDADGSPAWLKKSVTNSTTITGTQVHIHNKDAADANRSGASVKKAMSTQVNRNALSPVGL